MFAATLSRTALRVLAGALLLLWAAPVHAAGVLAIRDLRCDPPLLDPGGEGELRATVAAEGADPIDADVLTWELECPLLVITPASAPMGRLLPGETAVFTWALVPRAASGAALLRVVLSGPRGTRCESSIALRVGRGEVWISEVQYDPDRGEGEWIEVTNASAAPVDLTGWQMLDASRRATTIASGAPPLEPGGFALVAESAASLRAAWPEVPEDAALPRTGSWPALNNGVDAELGYADQILLLGGDGTPVDYVRYVPGDLDGDGVSLERWIVGQRLVDPVALVPCAAARGSTPGFAGWLPTGEMGAGADPDPFFPDRTDGPRLCRIALPRSFPAAQQVTADVFTLAGERVATLAAGARTSGPVILVWDGARGDGRPLPSGLYLVRAVLRSPSSGAARTQLRPVALLHE